MARWLDWLRRRLGWLYAPRRDIRPVEVVPISVEDHGTAAVSAVNFLTAPVSLIDRVTVLARDESLVTVYAELKAALSVPVGEDATPMITVGLNMAIPTELSMFRGEDRTWDFKLDAVPAGGFGGWVVTFAIVPDDSSPGTLPTLSLTATLFDAVNGIYRVVISRSDTINLLPRKYLWELSRGPAGQAVVLGYGEFLLKRNVT